MSDKTAKPRKGKRGDDAGVLGNLAATRPTRIGAERGEPKTAAKPKTTTTPTASAKPRTTAKPKTAAKRKATAKPKTAAKPRTTAKPKTAAKPTATAKPKTAAKPPAPAKPKTAAKPTAPRPRPVRAGAPALAESTERARSEPSEPLEPGASPPSGTELVTTAIQAAGELAQIGLKMSGHVLKRTVEKLPKP